MLWNIGLFFFGGGGYNVNFGVVYNYVAVRIWVSLSINVVLETPMLNTSFVLSAEHGGSFGDSDELKACSTLCRG